MGRTLLFVAIVAAALAGLSGLAAPADAAIVQRVLSYDIDSPPGDPNLNALDLYLPDGAQPSDSRPVVVYAHGGAWRAGDKANQIADKVAVQPVYAGEQVSTQRFRSVQEQGIQAQLKGNLRALQVPGSANQLLNGTLKDGDRIDVVGTWLMPETSQNHVSRVVLRNLLVLQAPSANSVESKLSSNPNEGFTVMLAMTDSQATKFWWVVNNGEWSLQLRPVTDPSDSPEEINNAKTNALDGLNARQRHSARSER